MMWSCNILLVARCILFYKNTLDDLFSVLNFLKRFVQRTIRCMQKMKLWQFALDLLDLPNSDLSWNFVAENIEMKITQVTEVEELTPASNFNTLRCSQIDCWKKSWDVAKMFVVNRGRADTGILAINSSRNQNTFAHLQPRRPLTSNSWETKFMVIAWRYQNVFWYCINWDVF